VALRLFAAIVAYLIGAAVLVFSLGVALEQALGPTETAPARQAAAPAGPGAASAPASAAVKAPAAGRKTDAAGNKQGTPARNAAAPNAPVARVAPSNTASAIGTTAAGTNGQGTDAFAPPSFAQPFVPIAPTAPAANAPPRGKAKASKPPNLTPGKPQGRSAADGDEPSGSPLDAQAAQTEDQPAATPRSEARPRVFHAKPPQAWLDH
jgi:hypothetical protein